ncbi:hypothetical protein [Cellulomonas sp. ATA003]|uniref:hypothetical protein n=1 Tax=Cellulomonas sp. ATA003 TaxID=3073064 RepID=UPI0028735A62|nr:hypothetical protein [Cellulomonas sp. ATA003]WNB87311.1 hypothetical protein REH70_09530 [Cellulomonas sp. ATA003]
MQVYDPTTDEWSVENGLPTGVGFAGAVSAGGSLFVIGGIESDGSTDAVYRLDSPGGQWQVDRPLPEPRGAGAAAYDGARIVFGGGVAREDGGPVRGDVWAMIPGQDWTRVGSITPAREKLAAATDGFGRVYFMAGRDRQAVGGEAVFGHVDVVTQTGVESLGERLPPLSAPGGAQLPGLGFCVVGGQLTSGDYNGRIHCVDGAPDPEPRALPTPRAGLGVAVLRQFAYAVGGYHARANGTSLVHRYDLPAD